MHKPLSAIAVVAMAAASRYQFRRRRKLTGQKWER